RRDFAGKEKTLRVPDRARLPLLRFRPGGVGLDAVTRRAATSLSAHTGRLARGMCTGDMLTRVRPRDRRGAMSEPTMTPEEFRETTARITDSVRRVIDGKEHAIRSALVVLLAEGHLLVEDVPGVGKTMLARALAASIDADVRRIQFTPDLLPGDVTGVSVFSPANRVFEFTPGAVFANVVIADEINRSSPKTQSALLEAMEERQVSVDGRTHPLPDPFLVIATQNPLEMDGTYALPEAQLDRFMMRMSMGYPDAEAEQLMLRQRDTHNPLADVRPVVTLDGVARLIDFAHRVHVAPPVEAYAVALAQATRTHPDLQLGASPR